MCAKPAKRGKEYIVELLCKRDGCSITSAEQLVDQTIEELEACGYDPDECEDIMRNNLGLEMDYIFELL